MSQTTEKKIEMIIKELKSLNTKFDRLADKVTYIDRNVEKYGDEFSVTDVFKNKKGELVLGKEKKLSLNEKRALVGMKPKGK